MRQKAEGLCFKLYFEHILRTMKIAIIGYGKMGREVEKAALARQHNIVVTVDNPQEWEERLDLVKQADVAIDFSQPDQVVANIHRCFDMHIPIVVGTTAWQDHFEEIKKRCLAEKQSLFTAPNFSIGMNIMFLLNKQLAKFAEKYDYQLSMAETHHIHKLDAPSGTAITLANDIIDLLDRIDDWKLVKGDSRRQKKDIVPITAIRQGEVAGIHEVVYDSDIDTITLRHSAKNRKGLALGALLAAEYLEDRKGYYTMQNLLEDSPQQ